MVDHSRRRSWTWADGIEMGHWEYEPLPKITNVPHRKYKKTRNRLPKEERKPYRYCHRRKEGYVYVPYGDIDVARYRLVAQWKLGRPLRKSEQVHHINGVKHDDRPENLQIMTWKEHRLIHAGFHGPNGQFVNPSLGA